MENTKTQRILNVIFTYIMRKLNYECPTRLYAHPMCNIFKSTLRDAHEILQYWFTCLKQKVQKNLKDRTFCGKKLLFEFGLLVRFDIL